MKLVTDIGQIELPQDYTIVMKRTNPLLSDEGDASIPATLPSSSRNLASVGHRDRIERAERFTNKIDALLEVGPIRKRGKLVIGTVHRHEGIDASFAIDNSDLYTSSKNKTLKEIIGNYKITFNSVSDACQHMEEVYRGGFPNADYVIFPVAVAPYEVEPQNGDPYTVYQYNNEINASQQLVYAARSVHEGDVDDMHVPEGYGVAPFLKLSCLVDILFRQLGYDVTENCLSQWPFRRMVIVHNCSDCLCNPNATLFYRDLVPSVTLSDFLTWLHNKFHVQPIVDSESRKAQIVSMESLLGIGADLDISRLAEGDLTVQLNPSSRVVLTPTNKLDGSEPAAETFDKLIEKYGAYYEVNETQFSTLSGPNPVYEDCLVLRLASGQFYALGHDPYIHDTTIRPVGTNYFAYDRNNAEASEEFSQEDSMPPMVENKGFFPYIGERLHSHTSYEGSTADDNQDIIVVQAETDNRFFYTTSGTTQRYIPCSNGDMVDLGLSTTPHGLYNNCWRKYNNILLNCAVHLTGRFKYSTAHILGMDMTRLKLCFGQRLLPVSAEGAVGAHATLAEAEFILVKTYIDQVTDNEILPGEQPKFKWEVTDNAASIAQHEADVLIFNFQPPGGIQYLSEWSLHYGGFDILYYGDDLNPGTPTYEGEVVTLTRLAKITLHMYEYIEFEDSQGNIASSTTMDSDVVLDNVTVTFTFTAVPR